MGCIFSCCENKSKKNYDISLISGSYCYQCHQSFKSKNEYHKHIPFCKKKNGDL